MKIYKRFFLDYGKIIGTFGLGFGCRYYKGYKLEVGATFFLWYFEINIYRNKQQLAGPL